MSNMKLFLCRLREVQKMGPLDLLTKEILYRADFKETGVNLYVLRMYLLKYYSTRIST